MLYVARVSEEDKTCDSYTQIINVFDINNKVTTNLHAKLGRYRFGYRIVQHFLPECQKSQANKLEKNPFRLVNPRTIK